MFEDFELDDETGMNLEDILPTNVEEARAFIYNDKETLIDVVGKAGFSVLVEMLIEKGIIDRNEFSNRRDKLVDKSINEMAEHLIMKLEEEVFEYEKD